MAENQQPRIPGVRYRKVKRTRWVETTFNGETRPCQQTYHEWEPVPPRNLDAALLRAVITVAVLMTAVAVVWSTAAIGGLLSLVVHSAVAYAAATSFELLWLVCLAVEWLERFGPKRATVARVAGWIGLGVVVAAVVAHGFHLDQRTAGIVGGGVSLIAKCMWLVVMRLFHTPLGEDAAAWLQGKREDLAVSRVMLGEQRRMQGVEAYMRHVYGTGPATAPMVTSPVAAQQLPPTPPASAVPPVSGQPSMPVTPPAAPVAAPVSGQAPGAPGPTGGMSGQQTPTPPPGPPITAIGESVAGTVRRYLAEHPATAQPGTALTGDQLDDMVDAVRQIHGDRPRLVETVRRTRDRQVEKLKKPGKTA